ncbi:hypothetical protein EGW03_04850 [bacterium]|nr:hypothetical protein [bacterium]
MEVKYEELIKKIKDICFNDFYVEIKYLLDDDKKRILSSMYQSVDDVQIDSFNEISSRRWRRWKIYEYNVRKNDEHHEKNCFLVCKDDIPVLKLENCFVEGKECSYLDSSYISYYKETHHIQSKIHFTSVRKDNFEDTSVLLLDSDEVCQKEYYQKKYHFTICGDEVISLQLGNEMFLNGESGFILRRDSALKCIGKIFNKIDNEIDKLKDIDIKEYKIKRK